LTHEDLTNDNSFISGDDKGQAFFPAVRCHNVVKLKSLIVESTDYPTNDCYGFLPFKDMLIMFSRYEFVRVYRGSDLLFESDFTFCVASGGSNHFFDRTPQYHGIENVVLHSQRSFAAILRNQAERSRRRKLFQRRYSPQ
jgi:hypothetical protein